MRWFVLLLSCLAGLAHADAAIYLLDHSKSQVAFSYEFEGRARNGTMPVKAADISLDLDRLANSRVDVTLNAAAVKAGFVMATQTIKSAAVLNVDAYPTIRFRSTRFRDDLNGATVRGQLTMRGVTRPVILRARLYRQNDTAPGDRRKLAVLLSGEVDRNAFGASGYPSYVGPRINLRILAYINKP